MTSGRRHYDRVFAPLTALPNTASGADAAACSMSALAKMTLADLPPRLQMANSIFADDYLTTKGQAASADLELIADCGLRVETTEQVTLPQSRLGRVVLKKSAFD